MIVERIETGKLNPFGATGQELVAYALDDAGMLTAETLIDGRPAQEFLREYFRKRDGYRESTRLGEVLVRWHAITEEQLAAALRFKGERPGVKLGEALLELHACRFEDIQRALDSQSRVRGDLADIDDHRAHVQAVRERLRQYF